MHSVCPALCVHVINSARQGLARSLPVCSTTYTRQHTHTYTLSRVLVAPLCGSVLYRTRAFSPPMPCVLPADRRRCVYRGFSHVNQLYQLSVQGKLPHACHPAQACWSLHKHVAVSYPGPYLET